MYGEAPIDASKKAQPEYNQEVLYWLGHLDDDIPFELETFTIK